MELIASFAPPVGEIYEILLDISFLYVAGMFLSCREVNDRKAGFADEGCIVKLEAGVTRRKRNDKMKNAMVMIL